MQNMRSNVLEEGDETSSLDLKRKRGRSYIKRGKQKCAVESLAVQKRRATFPLPELSEREESFSSALSYTAEKPNAPGKKAMI